MSCAVCSRPVSKHGSFPYALGECAGVLCSECQEGLGGAVRAWLVSRVREPEVAGRVAGQSERMAAQTQREAYPRGLKLVGAAK